MFAPQEYGGDIDRTQYLSEAAKHLQLPWNKAPSHVVPSSEADCTHPPSGPG